MGEVLKKFGRYILLDQIAQGGMAEIYRARLASAEGAARLIVIKRIQGGFGANEEFLKMFKSEIKVTMGFNHPCIVQLYDFGEEQKQPYIAMELVDGKNLRQIMGRFGELKQPFPVELAAHIIEQSSSGLHYAHSFKDKITGQPLNIVHRDISPQNILISYEGNVKVIDFGIAKTAANAESTRAGVIKGKPSYLSPEQISGEVLDGRSDIFALGICLWELLVGKKLFSGENDLAVLKQIESCQTHVKPPSTYNPRVPKEMDYIVLRALAKQRDKRFQTAEELQRALHKFLYAYAPDFNPADLSYSAKELFKDEIVEDRKQIQRLNAKVEQLVATEEPGDVPELEESDAAPAPRAKREDSTATVVDQKKKLEGTGAREFKVDKNEKVIDLDNSAGVKLQSGYGRSGSIQPQLQQVANRAQSRVNPQSRQAPRHRTSSAIQVPRQVRDGEGGGLGKLVALAASVVALVSVFGKDTIGVEVPVLTAVFESLMGKSSEAQLTLTGDAKNVTILVAGKNVGSELPLVLRGKEIPAGVPVNVVVTSPTGGFNRIVTLKEGEKRVLEVKLNAGTPNWSAGTKLVTLKLNITPGGDQTMASVVSQGRTYAIDLKSPNLQVPLDQPLELVVDKPEYKPFRRQFTLESRIYERALEAPMDVQLEPLRFGYLTLRTTPSAKVTIMIEGKPWVRNTPLENEKLPVGAYSAQLSNDILDAHKTVMVNIQDGKVLNLEEQFSSARVPAGK